LPGVLALTVVVFVVSVFIYGMYPSMVKDRIEKKELNFKNSFLFACHKFWSLFGAYLNTTLIMSAAVGAIAGAVVSLLILLKTPTVAFFIVMITIIMIAVFLIGVFFFYLFPAIIMDDLRAFIGLDKSLWTGKNNYLFTLLIFLIPGLIGVASHFLLIWLPTYLGIGTGYSLVLLIPYAVISLFVSTWMYIMSAYAYNSVKA
jgi:hypothetical protein